MIEVREVVVRYGSATALDEVSLSVAAGELVAMIGPNGAGKSTLVNTLAGLLKPVSGTVAISGRAAYVPEGRHLFGELTVEDNLRLGAWRSKDRDPSWIYELQPVLGELRGRRAATLSGGQQQMVAVARALMARPDVLVIDELSLGLAPIVVAELAAELQAIHREQGLALLLIEQNARLAFDLCDRAYVLEAGRNVTEGPCAELAKSPDVARAYLGGPIKESS
jgi:branched-chain amino acid transport system ATP-binding protein